MCGIREGVPTHVRKYAGEEVTYYKDMYEKKLVTWL